MANVFNATTTTGLQLTPDNSGAIQFQTNNGTTAMTITTGQAVGIGTSSVGGSYLLQTNGASPGVGIQTNIANGGAGAGWVDFLTQGGTVQANIYFNQASGFISFGTAPSGSATSERMRIDSSGNLCVGTTSAPSQEKFNVTGSSANFISRFYNTNASPNGVFVNYTTASPNGSGNAFYYASDSTALRFNVQSNGGIANYSANNTNLSDARLKKQIQLAGPYLEKICSIPVKTFLYNDQTDNELNLGVIAQDVAVAAPELVCRDGWLDKDGKPTDYLTIYQTDLQYALMKCIQELSAKLTALEAKIGA